MKNRGFEKVKIKEFKKHFPKEKYADIILPKRKTLHSAGYDFHVLEDYIIEENQEIIIKTGVKVSMQIDEVLLLFIRSSLGFKYNLRLKNQVGIIDSDYYNNENNDGHILIAVKNEGNAPVKLNQGDAFAQGVFMKYLLADEEEETKQVRIGGIGSTNKRET